MTDLADLVPEPRVFLCAFDNKCSVISRELLKILTGRPRFAVPSFFFWVLLKGYYLFFGLQEGITAQNTSPANIFRNRAYFEKSFINPGGSNNGNASWIGSKIEYKTHLTICIEKPEDTKSPKFEINDLDI